MAQIILRDLDLAFGDGQLLAHAALTIDKGQRIGVIGRNGAGKSTLLKIIAGQITPDHGEVQISQDCEIAFVEQNPQIDSNRTVYEHVASGLGVAGELLCTYRKILQDPQQDPRVLDKVKSLQHEITEIDGWRLQSILNAIFSTLSLPYDKPMSALSGGWLKKAEFAKALSKQPNLLLLDEPTNHIDFETITWLETHLRKFAGTILFITHDREFLDRLATHIIELDRGVLTKWPGNYQRYREGKLLEIEVDERQQREFLNKLAKEEQWIRQGIKARRTRNEGRARRLQEMRQQRANMRGPLVNLNLKLEHAGQSGNLVIEAKRLNYAIDQRPIVSDFSLRILRGDKISLIGPNGAGKTTLLNLLLNVIEPDSGTVRHGTGIHEVRFDQLRSTLKPDQTVIDIVAQGRDYITINGRARHIVSYLSDFLFTSRRARSPISSLSGGEQARVLMALFFSRPVNLMIMDEPTNDLDTDTLELLEELLLEFPGTLLLVSHDRRFIDNVATKTLAFEGHGYIGEYVGGYSDWLRQTAGSAKQKDLKGPAAKKPMQKRPLSAASCQRSKPSYREQQELNMLPEKIEQLENRLDALIQQISNSNFYQQEHHKICETNQEIAAIEEQLERCYGRWSELESRYAT